MPESIVCPACGAINSLHLVPWNGRKGLPNIAKIECRECHEGGPVLPGTTFEQAVAIFQRVWPQRT